jgi:hypothetical protein
MGNSEVILLASFKSRNRKVKIHMEGYGVCQWLHFFSARVGFMKVRLATCIMTLAAASVLFAQPKPVALVKVYVGSDGLANVVDGKGKDVAIPKEKTQVAISAPKLAPDKQSAGWLILRENCCTSYPIPTSVAIHTAKKTRLLGDGLMVYDWCFVGEGSQVARSTGTVHGMTSRHLSLYDSRSGMLLEVWNEEMGEALPTWAKDLSQ